MLNYITNFFKNFYHDDEDFKLKDSFNLTKTLDIGYPYRPTVVAYDKKLDLIAITARNILHIYGYPGTEVQCPINENANYLFFKSSKKQIILIGDKEISVYQLHACEEGTLVIWVNSINIATIIDSKISCAIVANKKLWLGVDNRALREEEDIVVLDLANFFPKTKILIKNKESRNNGGDVYIVSIKNNPVNVSLFLIFFNNGMLIIWDMQKNMSINRCIMNSVISTVSWNSKGNAFVCAFKDGKYSIYNENGENNSFKISAYDQVCCPIRKIEFISSNNYLCFIGGTPQSFHCEDTLTLVNTSNHKVFQFNMKIIDFIVIRDQSDYPSFLLVFTEDELIAIDLIDDEWKEINPSYLCSVNIPEIVCSQCIFLSHKATQNLCSKDSWLNSKDHSDQKSWMLRNNYQLSEASDNVSEIIITGHVEGVVAFWQAAEFSIHPLLKMNVSRYFGFSFKEIPDLEHPKISQVSNHNFVSNDKRYKINKLYYDTTCNIFVICGFVDHVMIFDCSEEHENGSSITVTTVNIVANRPLYSNSDSPTFKNTRGRFLLLSVFKIYPVYSSIQLSLFSQTKKLAIGTIHGFAILDYANSTCIYLLDTTIPNNNMPLTRSFSRLNRSFRRSFSRQQSFRNLHVEISRPNSFIPDYSIEAICFSNTQLKSDFISTSSGLKLFVGTNSGRVLIFTVKSHPSAKDDRFQTPLINLADEILLINKNPILEIFVLTCDFDPVDNDSAISKGEDRLVICTNRKVKIYNLRDLKLYNSARFVPKSSSTCCLKIEYVQRNDFKNNKVKGLVYLLGDDTLNFMSFPDLKVLFSTKCFEDQFSIKSLEFSQHGNGYFLSSPTSFGWFTIFKNDKFGHRSKVRINKNQIGKKVENPHL